MAIERTDYNHAAGVFNVNVPGNSLAPIAQDGFRAWVRDGVGRYRLQCVENIAYVESIVEVFPGLNAGAGSIAGQVTTPGIVIVNAYDGDNNPIDVAQFRIEIRQVATQAGPAGVEPPAPTPGGGGGGLGPVQVQTVPVQYYVNANTGNDANDGSALAPFLTLAPVQAIASRRILQADMRVTVTGAPGGSDFVLPSFFGAAGYEGGQLFVETLEYNVGPTDSAGGPTAAPVNTFPTTLAGFYIGQQLRVASGALFGQRRTIVNGSSGVNLSLAAALGLAPGDAFDVQTPANRLIANTDVTLSGGPAPSSELFHYSPSLCFIGFGWAGAITTRLINIAGRVSIYGGQCDLSNQLAFLPLASGRLLAGIDDTISQSAEGPAAMGYPSQKGNGLVWNRAPNLNDPNQAIGNITGYFVTESNNVAPGAGSEMVIGYGSSGIYGGNLKGDQTTLRVKGAGTRCRLVRTSFTDLSLLITNTDGVGSFDTAGVVIVEDNAVLDVDSASINGVAPGPLRAEILAESGGIANINTNDPVLLQGANQSYGVWARYGGKIYSVAASLPMVGSVANFAANGAVAVTTAAILGAVGTILIAAVPANNDGSVIQRTA